MTEGGECESRKLRLEARQAGRAGILAAPELPLRAVLNARRAGGRAGQRQQTRHAAGLGHACLVKFALNAHCLVRQSYPLQPRTRT